MRIYNFGVNIVYECCVFQPERKSLMFHNYMVMTFLFLFISIQVLCSIKLNLRFRKAIEMNSSCGWIVWSVWNSDGSFGY